MKTRDKYAQHLIFTISVSLITQYSHMHTKKSMARERKSRAKDFVSTHPASRLCTFVLLRSSTVLRFYFCFTFYLDVQCELCVLLIDRFISVINVIC